MFNTTYDLIWVNIEAQSIIFDNVREGKHEYQTFHIY